MALSRVAALIAALVAASALAAPAAAQTEPTAELIATIDTSAWSRPSPDPAGLAYLRKTGRLFVSDSEVEETPHYRRRNVFEIRKNGSVVRSFRITRFSEEPAGIAVPPRKQGTLFISDDDPDRIWILKWGRDRRWGTRDDGGRSFSTRRFGARDPEGVAFGRKSLFVTNGTQRKVFIVHRGRNGRFDGSGARSDDIIRSFGTQGLGLRDPEGIEYDPVTRHLFLVSRADNEIVEATVRGRLVHAIDISGNGVRNAAGIAMFHPRGDARTARIYVADRGIDNFADPQENDGKIFVFEVTWP